MGVNIACIVEACAALANELALREAPWECVCKCVAARRTLLFVGLTDITLHNKKKVATPQTQKQKLPKSWLVGAAGLVASTTAWARVSHTRYRTQPEVMQERPVHILRPELLGFCDTGTTNACASKKRRALVIHRRRACHPNRHHVCVSPNLYKDHAHPPAHGLPFGPAIYCMPWGHHM